MHSCPFPPPPPPRLFRIPFLAVLSVWSGIFGHLLDRRDVLSASLPRLYISVPPRRHCGSSFAHKRVLFLHSDSALPCVLVVFRIGSVPLYVARGIWTARADIKTDRDPSSFSGLVLVSLCDMGDMPPLSAGHRVSLVPQLCNSCP